MIIFSLLFLCFVCVLSAILGIGVCCSALEFGFKKNKKAFWVGILMVIIGVLGLFAAAEAINNYTTQPTQTEQIIQY